MMPNDIPALSKSQLGDNARPVERIREELQVLLGLRGDPLDKAITLRDALDRGLIDVAGRALTGSVTYQNYYPVVGGPVGDEPDLTPPPTPAGLTVAAGFSQVIVQWTAPTYLQGHGNAFTHVYAVKKAPSDASLPTFEPGVTPRVYSAPGKLSIVALASELNTRWHIWITHETVDGVESLTPAGGTHGFNVSGTYPTTGQDIAQLLELLTGQITESQLYGALASRISLVDAPATVAGSVAAKVKAETDARILAIGEEVTNRQIADESTLGAARAYAEGWSYSRAQTDSAVAAMSNSLTTAFSNADNSVRSDAQTYTQTYAYSKSAVDGALTTQGNTLRAEWQGADLTTLNSARAYAETWAYSKAAVDGAFSGQANSLRAEWQGNDATTLNSARAYTESWAYSKAAVDGAFSSSESALRAYADGAAGTARSQAVADAQVYTNDYAYAKANGQALASSVATLEAISKATALGWPLETWSPNGQPFANVSDGKVGSLVLRLLVQPDAYPYQNNFIPIDTTKKYRVRFWARPQGGADGVLYFSLRQFTAPSLDAYGPLNGGRTPYKPSGQSRAAHNAVYGTDQWGEYSYVWGAGDWQAGVKYVRCEFLDNYGGAFGWWEIQDFRMEEVTAFESLAATVQDVTTVQTDPTSGNSALASRTTTLEARVNSPSASPGANYNPTYAALQTEQSARAALDGAVAALWTLRAEVSSGGRTIVGGFGLSATATASAGPRIDFGVRADQFYVGAPAGSGVADRLPFIVRTSTINENGVDIPAGVYIDAAFIANLSALYARIANLVADQITAAEINAAKITFGTMSGDRIATNSLHGNRITANSIAVDRLQAGTLSAGWVFAGALSAATGTFSGALSAATGSFAGSLSAASGTFSGTLTADAVNAVNTVNIAGNAITVPTAVQTVASPAYVLETTTPVQVLATSSIDTRVNGVSRPIYVQVSFTSTFIIGVSQDVRITYTLRIVGGATLRTWSVRGPRSSAGIQTTGTLQPSNSAGVLIETPPNAPVSIELVAQVNVTPDGLNEVEVEAATLFVMGVKR